ncbi:probable protein phosphatase 2C 8 [Nicotiana sylvestris]|uniref:Probable protein phosphatase 2C 8 n=1 Tax=Nicotiana sylvestris TaxID=4096 RepID=A0A1U7V7E8_NICSY|nr:PREDICTED: probable protein phosphatase 2C 8 [Nicotiana sylvestris]
MMGSDSENNKPRNLFHRRVLKSYHKRQQIQRMTTSSEEENGCFVPQKRFRVKDVGAEVSKNDNKSSTSSSSKSIIAGATSSQISSQELKYGFISILGRRRVLEDAITVASRVANNEFVLFAAYDGHGGNRVSHACRDHLHYIIEEEILERKGSNNNSSMDWEKVMIKCFSKMDDEVIREWDEEVGYDDVARTVGSAAAVVVVGKREVVVANCGDCRVVLCSRGVVIPLSNDHKPERPDEKKRVEAAGGKILNCNGSRVQGVLATSRSIGDHYLKPFVIPEPEVTVYKRDEWDEFLVIATDGLWDVVSNEVTCEVVRKCFDGQIRRGLPERDRAADAAALLAELAIAKGSKDNISVIVVELDKSSDIKVS